MATGVDCERRDLRFVPYFEHQEVKDYIQDGSKGEGRKEQQRGYQYFTEGYILGVKSKFKCCM